MSETIIRLAVPKGRLEPEVTTLLRDVGLDPGRGARSYRPTVSAPDIALKMFKPQNIPALVGLGSADVGFTGGDWVKESGADVVEVLDLGFNPVRIVAAAGRDVNGLSDLKGRRVVVASEYEKITREFMRDQGLEHTFVRSYGATEVFPPEDADLIVDNVSTGATLASHGLKVLAEVMTSTTRFIAAPRAMGDPVRRERIEGLAGLMRSVLAARERVLLEMNVPADRLDTVVAAAPGMKSPTVSPLFGGDGFSVKVAVLRSEVPALVPRLKELGASDILEYTLNKIVI
ncbi:MAG: ATP phosphoribosyltransferase [Deltaproteobacteria bacterium]|nr:ATP phosphoribosyltransferase [Deltaproteobacteria bacterium]